MDQLAEYNWSHFCYSPLITRGSVGRVLMVTVRLLSTHHPWIGWLSTAGHTYATLHSSPMDQLAEYSCSKFGYAPLSIRGLAAEHSWSHFGNSSLITRDQLAEYSWSNFGYSPVIIRGSAGRGQLVTLRLLSTHHQWVSWQRTAGHTSVTLHSSPVDQMAEHSWSHFCYSPLITRRSAGTVLLVTLRLLSTQHPCVSWKSRAGHTSVTLHSSPVDQLAKHSWSHFCYSPLTTRGSTGSSQLVTLLLFSTHHPWISRQSTAGHNSATLHS